VLRESPHAVDVEADVDPAWRRGLRAPGRVLLSHHDFSGTPRGLPRVLARLRREAGPGAPVKLVTTASRLGDAVAVHRTLQAEGDALATLFAMGPPGVLTRLMALAWGSRFTYGAVREGSRTAPGQPTLRELALLYRVRSLGPRTRLYAVAGTRVEGSLSPVLHNTIFALAGARAVYSIAPGDDLRTIVAGLSSLGRLAGLSVTAPHKEQALAMADDATPVARAVGAANLLLWRGRRCLADNTDVDGFLEALGERCDVRGRSVVLVGTGGAARGCLLALRRAGARVTVVGRRASRFREIAPLHPGATWVSLGSRALGRLDGEIWINATSAAASPLPEGLLLARRRRGLAFDLAYTPAVTPFLEEAAAAGLATCNGLRMLHLQALRQARHFLGRPVTPGEARAAARAVGLPAVAPRRGSDGLGRICGRP
jgi:shikimate dehydrogenase